MKKSEIEEKLISIKNFCGGENTQRELWADRYARLAAGDESVFPCLFKGFEEEPKKLIVINHIEVKCDSLAGELKKKQLALLATPTISQYSKFANQLSKCLSWFSKKTKRYSHLATLFRNETTKTGIGFIRYQRSFVDDIICGNPVLRSYTYNEIEFDTQFKNIDLSDCRYISFKTKHTKKNIQKMLGQKIQFDDVFRTMDEYNLCRLEEMYYLDYRSAKILYNKQTQAQQELLKKDEYKIEYYLNRDPNLKVEEINIPTVRLAIRVNENLVYDGNNELGIDRYPSAAFIGDWNPALCIQRRFKGIPARLAEPQFFRSYIQTIQLKNLDDYLNPGFIYPTDVPDNQKDLYNVFKKRNIPTKPGKDPRQIIKIPPNQIDASSILFSNQSVQELDLVSGISPAASGTDGGDVPGITNNTRKQWSFNNYSHYYDNYFIADQLLGNIFIEDIIKNYSKQKLQTILQEEPSPEFFTSIKDAFTLTHGNGEDTTDQLERKRIDLGTLKSIFGIDSPPDVILSTYDLLDKEKIIKNIREKADQASQMAKYKSEQEALTQASERKVFEATALQQMGSALERSTKASENKASIETEEIERIERLAKVLKDLDSINIDNLNFYIDTINKLQVPSTLPTPNEEAIIGTQIESILPNEEANENQRMQQQRMEQL